MGLATSYGVGAYAALEAHRFWATREYRYDGSRRVTVFCHGAGGTYAIGPHESFYATEGFPLIASDLGGGQTWGSDASLAMIDTVWQYAVDNFGAADDQMLLWGGSMGSLTAILYALDNPENVAAVGCALPIMDPEQVRNGPADAADRATGQSAGGTTTPSYKTEIEAVHGAGVVPDAKRPVARADELEVPAAFWISETDTVGAKGRAYDFADEAGVETHSMGSVGHSYLSMDDAEMHEFFGPYVKA